MIIQSIGANTYRNTYCHPKKNVTNASNINFTGIDREKVLRNSKSMKRDANDYLSQGVVLRDKMLDLIEKNEHSSDMQLDPSFMYEFNFEEGEGGKEILNLFSKSTGNLVAKTSFYYEDDEANIDLIEVYNQQNGQIDKYSYIDNRLANVHKDVKDKRDYSASAKYILYLQNNDYKVYTGLSKKKVNGGAYAHKEQYNFQNDELAVYKKYSKMKQGYQETIERVDFNK